MITTQTGHQPADFSDVRATNLAVVLRFVRANAPCSRADIAANTGLNKATVSSLVAELIDRRLLRETGLTEHRIGRPATMIVVDGAPFAAVGLEVTTDHLTAVALDLAGERLLSWRRAFTGAGTNPHKAVASIAALARRAVAKVLDDGREVLGLTVGVAGLVDGEGVVRLAPNLGWQDIDLRTSLTRALRQPAFPIAVDNDANLGVRAEHRYGAHAGVPNLVYVDGQVGIGAGVVTDGRVLRGGYNYAGEIGHVQLDPDGEKCACGRRGCLEVLAGIGSLVRHLGADRADPEALAAGDLDLEPEIDDIVRRANAREPRVLAALQAHGQRLGHGLSILANMVNPQVVVLGGYFVPLAPWIMPAVEEELRTRTVAPDAGGCRLDVSTLGHGAAALGGAASVLDSIDSGRLPATASSRAVER